MSLFNTSISAVVPGEAIIRGYSHADLIGGSPYVANAFLVLVGRLPSTSELPVMEAMLTSVIDHGFVSVTTSTGRYAASGNPNLVSAVAAGLLAAGENTLSPAASFDMISQLAADPSSLIDPSTAARAVVDGYLAAGRRVPGLGHPTHRDTDYRSDAVFRVAREHGVAGRHCELMDHVLDAFSTATGKDHIPINIDGCLAAVALDMGLERESAVAISLLGVLPGLIAHVAEQIQSGDPLRYIVDGSYNGEPRRELTPGIEESVDER